VGIPCKEWTALTIFEVRALIPLKAGLQRDRKQQEMRSLSIFKESWITGIDEAGR